MKLLNKAWDYIFDVHGRPVFLTGFVVLAILILISVY